MELLESSWCSSISRKFLEKIKKLLFILDFKKNQFKFSGFEIFEGFEPTNIRNLARRLME
jgi:hypothetical protein